MRFYAVALLAIMAIPAIGSDPSRGEVRNAPKRAPAPHVQNMRNLGGNVIGLQVPGLPQMLPNDIVRLLLTPKPAPEPRLDSALLQMVLFPERELAGLLLDAIPRRWIWRARGPQTVGVPTPELDIPIRWFPRD
jgi:hypothetical protein